MTAIWQSVRRRIKASDTTRIREIAISAMILVILTIGVVRNLPDSALTQAALPTVDRIALPLGLDQNWSMYAPNPPRRQENIEVRITMADGGYEVWTLPRLNPIFGVGFSHRWRKFKETLVADEQVRPDFVHWVVREMTPPGEHPARVDMFLQTEELPPPGVSRPGSTAVQTLYSEDLTGNR